jgi:hypothetical protein
MRARAGWPTQARQAADRSSTSADTVDKPVTTLDTRITNQDGVIVVDGTAVVWRDPVAVGVRNPASAPVTETTD